MAVIQLNPLGGLDLDSDLQYIANGDQTYNKNTRGVTKGGQTSRSKEIIKGNSAAYQIGTAVSSAKVYRVYVNASDAATVNTFTFYNQNHELLVATPTLNSTVGLDAGNIAAYLATLKAAIDAMLTGDGEVPGTNTFAYDVAAHLGYIDIELDTYPGQDYYLKFSAVSINPVLDAVVITEAVDNTIAGSFEILASEDYLGKLFQFSTTQTEMPEVFDISGVTNSAGLILVRTTTPCHVATGDCVLISGTGYTTSAGGKVDGKFIATFVDATRFTLDGAAFGTGGTLTGTVTTNSVGMGEIGVSILNENTDTWTYTRLLRTKEFNWRLQRQHDRPKITYDNGKYNIYYTDNYNNPGVVYYYGAFYQDGAIEVYNPETNEGDRGIYEYDFIADEVRLQQNINNAILTFPYSPLSQDTAGGVLAAGSYRYTQRLLTETLTATPYASLSNPVPVFRSDQNGPAFNVLGSRISEGTAKINHLTVTNIDTNLFKYIELVSIFYNTNQSIQAYTISRSVITGDTMVLSHSGNETGTAILDVDALLAEIAVVERAKSNLILENRYLLGNVTLASQYDLTPWTTTFTHLLSAVTLNDIGDIDNYHYGEFQKPENVYGFTGYMLQETYRFFLRPYYKNGVIGDPFYIDDIDFTTSATNVVTSANQPYGNRRTAGLTNYDLTDGAASPNRLVYSFFAEFANINLDYILPDGLRIRDVLSHFEIGRAECRPQVLFSGIVIPSELSGGFYFPQDMWQTGVAAPAIGTYVTGLNNPARSLGFAVVPDALYGQLSLDFQAGDKVYLYGGATGGVGTLYVSNNSVFANFNGVFPAPLATPLKTIETVQTVTGFGQTGSITTTALGTVNYALRDSATPEAFYEASFLIGLGATVNDYFEQLAATDAGIYNIAYIRQNTNIYGTITEGEWIPTGHRYDIVSSSPSVLTGQGVFGGDVFTQKSWLHEKYLPANMPNFSGGGIGYYSQNRVNVQLHYNQTGAGFVWPENFGSFTQPLTPTWLQTIDRDKFGYASTYSPANLINDTKVWDSALTRNYSFPARIYYTGVKPEGSVADIFRLIQPLNFYDCDFAYGELMHISNIAGELITLQQDAVFRQYFSSSGNLQTTNTGQEIVIGSGGVFPRRGTLISNIGTRHKFSVIEAITANGHPFVTWVSTDYKLLMKYDPYSGSRAISIPGFRSYLLNNLTYVQDYDMPAYGLGIHGVSNQRYSEVIYTIRGEVANIRWEEGVTYGVGTKVRLIPPGAYTTYESFNLVYTAQVAVLSSLLNMPGEPAGAEVWTVSTEYNRFTFVYGETENKVICFATFRPKIYLKYLDTFLSPFPGHIGDFAPDRIYEHDKGAYVSWYQAASLGTPNAMNFTQGSTTVTTSAGFTATFPLPNIFCYVITYLGVEYIVSSVTSDTSLELERAVVGVTGTTSGFFITQSEDAEVEMVANALPNIAKWYQALFYATEIVPFRIELATAAHLSFLTFAEFEAREGYWIAAIQMDSTLTGLNDGDTSELFGRYLKVKLKMERRIYQKLFDFIVKFFKSSRNSQQ